MKKIKNIAIATGFYNNLNTILHSNENEVSLINNFEIIKNKNL